jgi:hypothetical protein
MYNFYECNFCKDFHSNQNEPRVKLTKCKQKASEKGFERNKCQDEKMLQI